MKDLPLISVIIPVYNVEKYLDECINSVLNQTYSNIEIILVDDGSTDSSGIICDKYAEEFNNIVVFHKENGGQSTARNLGCEIAKGEYIYFIDSDDILLSNALNKLCELAELYAADVVFFDAESFSDCDYNINVKQNYIRRHSYPVQDGITTFTMMQDKEEYHCVVWGMFLNRKFLLNNSISFIPGIFYEDMAYTFEVLCQAKTVVQCKDILYKHRYRVNSTMTSNKTKKYFDSCSFLYKSVRDFSQKKNIDNEDYAKKYISRIAFNVFNNYAKLSYKDKQLCHDEFVNIKKDILLNNAYGNIALKMKCYSNLLWIVYKVFEKTIGKVFKK